MRTEQSGGLRMRWGSVQRVRRCRGVALTPKKQPMQDEYFRRLLVPDLLGRGSTEDPLAARHQRLLERALDHDAREETDDPDRLCSPVAQGVWHHGRNECHVSHRYLTSLVPQGNLNPSFEAQEYLLGAIGMRRQCVSRLDFEVANCRIIVPGLR